MFRVRILAALAGLALATAVGTPAAAGPVTSRQFVASGGNYCDEGGTTGRLSWHGDAAIYQVHVSGIVTARAVDHDDPRLCGGGARTVATFAAYTNGWLVARETVEVVSDTTTVDLDLVALAVIDLVVVEVCWPPDIQSPEGDIPDRCFTDRHVISRVRS